MSAEAVGPTSANRLRTTIIINPVAGRASSRFERRQRIEDFVRHHRIPAAIEVSRQGGHAHELARAAQAQGAELVVSVGGDGTMNEVASALVGTRTLYGMVPTGSGNGLGRDLGIPLDLNQALNVLLDASVREIDTGVVNGLPFFNVMGLGFDAEIGRRFNLGGKRGFLSYLRIGVTAFFSHRKEPLVIENDTGAGFSVEAFVACVANSTQYGNNARIAPRARLDDGRIDVVAINTRNPIAAIPLVLRMFAGTIDRSRRVRTRQGTRFTIRRRAAGPIHTDGEVHDCEAVLEVSVRPRSLRVLVPRGAPEAAHARPA